MEPQKGLDRGATEAHASASRHRAEVLDSEACGCFYCLRTFRPSEIGEWIDGGETALCPKCGIDAVIGSSSGWPLEPDFLTRMHVRWFAGSRGGRAGSDGDPELAALLGRMREVAKKAYWLFFWSGLGGEVHAFIEVNGLIQKYVELCARAAELGIDFRAADGHSGDALPMQVHDARYLAEKLSCMFGPSLRANPNALEAFKRGLGIE